MNLSETSLAFLGCPINLEDPAPAIDWLSQAVVQGRKNAVPFVAVNAKFKAPRGIKTFNVGTNYPTELARLATHANWVGTDGPSPSQDHDAQTLFCLDRFVQAHPDVQQIVLIAENLSEDDDLTSLLQTPSPKPFRWLGRHQQTSATTKTGPIVFDRNNADSDTTLKLALDIVLSGAIYGFDPYSFEAVLNHSMSAATIVTRCLSAGENGRAS